MEEGHLQMYGTVDGESMFSFDVVPYSGADNAHAAFNAAWRTWQAVHNAQGEAGVRDGDGIEAVMHCNLHFGHTSLPLFSQRLNVRGITINDALNRRICLVIPVHEGEALEGDMTGWLTGWGSAEETAHLGTAPYTDAKAGNLTATQPQEFLWLDLDTGRVYDRTVGIHPAEPKCDDANPDREHRWRSPPDAWRQDFQEPGRMPAMLECCIDCGLARSENTELADSSPRTFSIRYWQVPDTQRARLGGLEAGGEREAASTDSDWFLNVAESPYSTPLPIGPNGEESVPFKGAGDAARMLADILGNADDGDSRFNPGHTYLAIARRKQGWADEIVAVGGMDRATGEVRTAETLNPARRFAWQVEAKPHLMLDTDNTECIRHLGGPTPSSMTDTLANAVRDAARAVDADPDAAVADAFDRGVLLMDLLTGEMRKTRPAPRLAEPEPMPREGLL